MIIRNQGRFWEFVEDALASNEVVIDRRRGSRHPRFPEVVYPLDYGYLDGTSSMDNGGIDVWVGSLPERNLNGVVCCFDAMKGDMELKLLLGCTPQEMEMILIFHDCGWQGAMLIER